MNWMNLSQQWIELEFPLKSNGVSWTWIDIFIFTLQGFCKIYLLRRAFEHIFEAIDASENMKYLVHASYLEIYNEDLFDLLGDGLVN